MQARNVRTQGSDLFLSLQLAPATRRTSAQAAPTRKNCGIRKRWPSWDVRMLANAKRNAPRLAGTTWSRRAREKSRKAAAKFRAAAARVKICSAVSGSNPRSRNGR
jgi:hypothetical protein